MRPMPSNDVDVYLVLDDFGDLGRAWREVDEEGTDRATVNTNLLGGLLSDPVRVVAFNTAKTWSRDVSNEIAEELTRRLALEGREASRGLRNFLERHGSGGPAQPPLHGLMPVFHHFEAMTPGKRPQESSPGRHRPHLQYPRSGWGEYPDTMPQAILLTDAEGRTCTYVTIRENGVVVDSKGYSARS